MAPTVAGSWEGGGRIACCVTPELRYDQEGKRKKRAKIINEKKKKSKICWEPPRDVFFCAWATAVSHGISEVRI